MEGILYVLSPVALLLLGLTLLPACGGGQESSVPAVRPGRREALYLAGILLLTLGLALYYTLPRLRSADFGHDEGYYMAMARRVVEEGVYSYGASGEPNAFVPPGLPLYLALCCRLFGFGPSGLAVMRLLQVSGLSSGRPRLRRAAAGGAGRGFPDRLQPGLLLLYLRLSH